MLEFTVAFLRCVFPEGTPGYIRFVLGTPGNFPGREYRLPADVLWQSDEFPIDSEGQDVFFCPHPINDPTGPLTKNNAMAGNVVWLECDDEEFSPLSILPTIPSAVVETSKGRTHAYWFLSQPTDPLEIEATNKALAYRYLTKDRSGWHLNKLLRVPGFHNSKYDPPYLVDFKTLEPGRRYCIGDFESLPQVIDEYDTSDEVPKYDPAAREEVLNKYRDQLPVNMVTLLEVRQKDRSKALWALASMCQRIGMTAVEAFMLLHESPNNKFLDNRFNSDLGLWKTVSSAFRNSINVDRQGAMAKIRQLKTQRGIPLEVRFEETARLVYRTMALEGSFYYCPRTKEAIYFTLSPMRSVTLGPTSLDCQTYLGTNYMLNGTTTEFKFVAEYLRAQVETDAPRIHLRDLSYYDRTAGLLYVTDFRGGIYRLDGERIEHVHNGVDDGVFFRAITDSEPYYPDFSAKPEDLYQVFNKVRLATDQPEEDVRFFIQCWFMALFFGEIFETRPLLILEGPHGSGKSVAFKCMEWVLRGIHGKVGSLPPDARHFRVAVRERSYVFFDGVDEPFRGLAELLSTTATGTVDRQRILYTDNRIAEYELKSFIGISTMNAHFMRHDVSDRAVTLRTMRRETFTPEGDIKAGILGSRNKIWGALLIELNKAVAAIKTYRPPDYNLRMADFAKFLATMCHVHGLDTERLLRFMKKEQDNQVLKRNVLWETLKVWLRNDDNINRPVTAQELHIELSRISAVHHLGYGNVCGTPKALAGKLQQIQPNVGFVKELAASGDKWAYRFPPSVRERL